MTGVGIVVDGSTYGGIVDMWWDLTSAGEGDDMAVWRRGAKFWTVKLKVGLPVTVGSTVDVAVGSHSGRAVVTASSPAGAVLTGVGPLSVVSS